VKKKNENLREVDMRPKISTMKVAPKTAPEASVDHRDYLVRAVFKQDFLCNIGGRRYAFKEGEERVIPVDVYACCRRNKVVYEPHESISVVRED
jgi:hypothetical protein